MVLLFVSDQLMPYATALLPRFDHWVEAPRWFRQGWPLKPRWRPLPDLLYVQVVKRRMKGYFSLQGLNNFAFYAIIFIAGRGSIVWPNARAWRAREPKGSVGSNPTLSALETTRETNGLPQLSIRVWKPPLFFTIEEAVVVSRLGVAVLPGAESSGLKRQSPFQGLDFRPAGLGSSSPNVYVRA